MVLQHCGLLPAPAWPALVLVRNQTSPRCSTRCFLQANSAFHFPESMWTGSGLPPSSESARGSLSHPRSHPPLRGSSLACGGGSPCWAGGRGPHVGWQVGGHGGEAYFQCWGLQHLPQSLHIPPPSP
ncbi:unnamed protein product [Eretmochelys imbricata]